MRLADLPDLPPGGLYRGLVYHWSAGRYTSWFDHYNLCVLGPPRDGEVVLSYPIARNLRRIPAGAEDYAAHTRGRNSGRVGIGAMCAYRAVMGDYGAFPPTPRQIETMCALGGLVSRKYGDLERLAEQVRTHYQWAVEDGYWPNRWNWQKLAPGDPRPGHEVLLAKTRYYYLRAR